MRKIGMVIYLHKSVKKCIAVARSHLLKWNYPKSVFLCLAYYVIQQRDASNEK